MTVLEFVGTYISVDTSCGSPGEDGAGEGCRYKHPARPEEHG